MLVASFQQKYSGNNNRDNHDILASQESYFQYRPSLLHMHCDCFKNFKDLIFVDDKLPAKTAKIMSLKNLYACGTCTSA